ncbi:hypothetical protein U1Q18_051482, partial [Sarracenia purpurea var. burkii]
MDNSASGFLRRSSIRMCKRHRFGDSISIRTRYGVRCSLSAYLKLIAIILVQLKSPLVLCPFQHLVTFSMLEPKYYFGAVNFGRWSIDKHAFNISALN